MMEVPNIVLKASHISKDFYDPQKFRVLNDVNLEVKSSEFISVTGKSGCGKSTLLYVLSTMDTDYEGDLILDGRKLNGLPGSDLAQVRNEKIGFVFQFHYLLSEFNVLWNVMLPAMKLGRRSKEQIEHNASMRLKELGVLDQAMKLPNQLSGGQKQRVAIARALINDPLIIMGDEPTGNLDKKNSDLVFDIFRRLAAEENQTIMVVTHDHDFAARTDRIVEMEDGRIIGS
jgi:lipoprotein-releasing system ATP-binding protein